MSVFIENNWSLDDAQKAEDTFPTSVLIDPKDARVLEDHLVFNETYTHLDFAGVISPKHMIGQLTGAIDLFYDALSVDCLEELTDCFAEDADRTEADKWGAPGSQDRVNALRLLFRRMASRENFQMHRLHYASIAAETVTVSGFYFENGALSNPKRARVGELNVRPTRVSMEDLDAVGGDYALQRDAMRAGAVEYRLHKYAMQGCDEEVRRAKGTSVSSRITRVANSAINASFGQLASQARTPHLIWGKPSTVLNPRSEPRVVLAHEESDFKYLRGNSGAGNSIGASRYLNDPVGAIAMVQMYDRLYGEGEPEKPVFSSEYLFRFKNRLNRLLAMSLVDTEEAAAA